MLDMPWILQMPAGVSTGGAFGHDIVQMILHAGLMVKFVMLILLGFSIVSWAIIFLKWKLIRKANQKTAEFLDDFWETRDWKKLYSVWKDSNQGPVAYLFMTGYIEFSRIRKIQTSWRGKDGYEQSGGEQAVNSQQIIMGNLERSLKKGITDQTDRLERALSFLATTGNTAPFIGLFGTVWGIMESFRGIGLKGSANLAVVAPGISEALIATAAGLAAAIPAVVAFNYFAHRISAIRAEMEIFSSDFLIMVERQFFKRQMVSRADK
jgi:biopolymer transport protein TolQ